MFPSFTLHVVSINIRVRGLYSFKSVKFLRTTYRSFDWIQKKMLNIYILKIKVILIWLVNQFVFQNSWSRCIWLKHIVRKFVVVLSLAHHLYINSYNAFCCEQVIAKQNIYLFSLFKILLMICVQLQIVLIQMIYFTKIYKLNEYILQIINEWIHFTTCILTYIFILLKNIWIAY